MCRLGATQDAAGLTVVGAPGPRVVGQNVDRPRATKHAPRPCFAVEMRTFPPAYSASPSAGLRGGLLGSSPDLKPLAIARLPVE